MVFGEVYCGHSVFAERMQRLRSYGFDRIVTHGPEARPPYTPREEKEKPRAAESSEEAARARGIGGVNDIDPG